MACTHLLRACAFGGDPACVHLDSHRQGSLIAQSRLSTAVTLDNCLWSAPPAIRRPDQRVPRSYLPISILDAFLPYALRALVPHLPTPEHNPCARPQICGSWSRGPEWCARLSHSSSMLQI